jgi:hypothetical protein
LSSTLQSSSSSAMTPLRFLLLLCLYFLTVAGSDDKDKEKRKKNLREPGPPNRNMPHCPPNWQDPNAVCKGPTSLMDGRVCTYGKETCCGVTYPSVVCTCRNGNLESCYNSDACMASCESDSDCESRFDGASCDVDTCTCVDTQPEPEEPTRSPMKV